MPLVEMKYISPSAIRILFYAAIRRMDVLCCVHCALLLVVVFAVLYILFFIHRFEMLCCRLLQFITILTMKTLEYQAISN